MVAFSCANQASCLSLDSKGVLYALASSQIASTASIHQFAPNAIRIPSYLMACASSNALRPTSPKKHPATPLIAICAQLTVLPASIRLSASSANPICT